jgi:hypothetical protein
MKQFYLKYQYGDDIRKQHANDTKWYLTHYFGQGWHWYRYSDDVKISLFDLLPYQISFKYFPHIDSNLIEEIVAIRKEKDRKESEWRSFNPIKIEPLDSITLPLIKKAFPTNPIAELVGVQPMMPTYKRN